jgi:hypothetical protein
MAVKLIRIVSTLLDWLPDGANSTHAIFRAKALSDLARNRPGKRVCLLTDISNRESFTWQLN